jgi:hypothetical protein
MTPPLPPGIANNNPLNLRPIPDGTQYRGQAGVDPRGLLVFDTIEDGYRAATRDLWCYEARGWTTLQAIEAAWAPVGDGANDPVAYAATMSQLTGWPVDQVLDLRDPAQALAFERAATRIENGDPNLYGFAIWFPDPVIQAGIAAAAS